VASPLPDPTRWEWRDTPTSLLLTHDPRSAAHQLVAARRWRPTTSATLAVRSPRSMREETLVEQLSAGHGYCLGTTR